ncbi:hypothetical protein J2736_005500 [Paenibacillus qinlingensis]|uniref:Uncharacterized protein n=1 Tax=Paenibacillus qinlingensis TaxID=1837343 RepID=A0ABU1P4I6_9BACL|nr:hypothetical protein [Paenibacillus qinlingensis]
MGWPLVLTQAFLASETVLVRYRPTKSLIRLEKEPIVTFCRTIHPFSLD